MDRENLKSEFSKEPSVTDRDTEPDTNQNFYGMAKPSANSSEMSVKERRLRPIYDLLDGCNNKRAVQEVDRLLKKQPNFTCAKVLKALALLRMNKPQECIAIVNPIISECPVEDNILQALSICYRELEQPEMVCQLYENASKIEPTEEMLTQCFLAYVRVGDFQSQYKAAMKLYKAYKKGPYFCWAIMSLVAQAVHDPSSQAARVSLPLAERMMAKFIDESQTSKTETEKELTLFMLILQKQRNYGRLLELLEDTVRPTVSAITGLHYQLRIECLRETQQLDILAQYMESSILGKPNEWQYYSEYLSLIESIGESRVEAFLNKVLDLYRSEIPPKATFLAFFRLYDVMVKRSTPECQEAQPAFQLIQDYLKHYGHKASCVTDMLPFLRVLSIEGLTKLVPEEGPVPIQFKAEDFSINHVRLNSNYQQFRRFLRAGSEITLGKLLGTTNLLVQKYLSFSDKLNMRRHSPDISVTGEFMKLAALHLADSFWTIRTQFQWVGVYQTLQKNCQDPEFLDSVSVGGKGPKSTAISNGIVHKNVNANTSKTETNQHTKFLVEETDFPILVCCSILTYALDENTCGSQIRLILAKVYIRCGAIGAAMEILEKLDLKYIQYESVGYIYMWQLAECGFINAGLKTMKAAETFYGVYQKESLEHILSAYKYGAWSRVLEFAAFRKRLLNSVQSYSVRVDSKLLEYLRDGHSRSQTIQIKQSGSGTGMLDINSIPWDELTDGRDLRALKDYRRFTNIDEYKKISFHANKHRLKIRIIILTMLNDAIGILQEENAIQPSVAEKFLDNAVVLHNLTHPDMNLHQFEVDEGLSIDAMWPPRLAHYIELGHPECFKLFSKIIHFLVGDATPPPSVAGAADDLSALYKKRMHELLREFETAAKTLSEVADYLRIIFDLLENLGFACIFLDVMSHILNKELNQKEKSKKKKTKDVGINPIYVRSFLLLHATIKNCYMDLSYIVTRFNVCLQAEYSATISEELMDTWGLNFDIGFTHVLSEGLPVVLDNIQSSYAKSIDEISGNIKSKLRYLNTIQVQSS